jgi:hypothetical protein
MANAKAGGGAVVADKLRPSSSASAGHFKVTSVDFKLEQGGNIECLEWKLEAENISKGLDLRLCSNGKEIKKEEIKKVSLSHENIQSVCFFEHDARRVLRNPFRTQLFSFR